MGKEKAGMKEREGDKGRYKAEGQVGRKRGIRKMRWTGRDKGKARGEEISGKEKRRVE